MSFPPNISPRIFTISSFLIGYALIDELTALEQNSVANWFFMVAQTLATSSAQQLLIESRVLAENINVNRREYNMGGSPFVGGENNQTKDVELMKKVIAKMQSELDKISKQ